MNQPRPETTPGVFLAHFDLSEPLGNGEEVIIYHGTYLAAKELAAGEGWTFRSYSSKETPGTRQDFLIRNIRSFPMVILYRDGIELGRISVAYAGVSYFRNWSHKLLGMETEELPAVRVPQWLLDGSIITAEGMVLKKAPGPDSPE